MAKRAARPTGPKSYVSKQFTLDDIGRGIEKLNRRIAEVQALQESGVRYDDQAIDNAALNIQEAIREVFGEDSAEYDAHRYHRIWHGSTHIGMTDHERQAGFQAGIPRTIAMLHGLITRLKEKRAELTGDATQLVHAALRGFNLHQRIAEVVTDLYENRHYADAVLRGTIALKNFVQEKSGRDDLDGAPLMRTVFSRNNPVLAFNDLSDQTAQDEQEGMMHLFEGVMLGIRNPRAHDILNDDPQRALEYIVLISLLAKRVEEAKLTAAPKGGGARSGP